MKLSKRIILYSTVSLFILLLAVNTSIYFIFENYTKNAELSRAVSSSHSIVEAIQPSSSTANPEAEYNPTNILEAYVPGDGMVRIIGENNQTMLMITKDYGLSGLDTQFRNREETEKITYDNRPYAVVRTPMIWSDGSIVTLEVNEPMVIYEQTVSTLQVILLLASVLILVPSYFAGRALSRFILKPIQALVDTMNEIRERGAFKKIEVNANSKDELDQMGITFNHMMDLLKKNFEKQEQFVSDASHELKTPLTVIESYARLLKRWGMKRQDVLEEAVEAIYSESQRMKEMTNQMLVLATGDSEKVLDLKKVNLLKLIKEITQRLSVTYQRDIYVQEEVLDPTLMADEGKIKQLLFIILENGLKYSDEKLHLTLAGDEITFKISVQDYGIGIPANDIPRIFERFYRVDKARTRKTGGTGLGLSIAKGIVDSHQGTIRVNSEEGVGTTFLITLPREQWKQKGEE
ncbi:sensor histidine kinase [Evansella tamaricis]|uniref:Signal transduction histidine-protein kinase ArlS n=1 Tax=Evansella tamaricis TaxID=2069301 RepID=A0ABS6JIH7_9BACI|nr:HAMP domain-containing sensor histidine kinase [Evansella tamaricis]MBU9713477.1 HAMP domain-containing histidine kinase [Evansella tamaricis]